MSNSTKTSRPFYAVRVTLAHDGGTTTRDYVRGASRMSKTNFASFALGDLLRLTGIAPDDWTIVPIEESEVHPGW